MAMAKARQVQHRPEREQARGKELAEARREIKQLKRLVSRLQKTIQKMEDQRGIQVDVAEASPEPVTPGTQIVQADPAIPFSPKCPACLGTLMKVFTTPSGKQIVSCANCKFRLTS